ncbi:MAG: aldehyde:ferredoxin oxidoreductase [Candidatus Edwardsbacteria bacterium]|nr:aldehyde:ferredoxin oxidoreductase [Candidatus Edwardsbacteria bacterium]MBU1575992.1 aldehyde:ferredoxin oxidoreductase [Candidatus Edwardsbacteria bacterium]MBU2463441.1 aldehyde:ferredoxin oxidoreductase [Candidatus Edwardsbacteria bacterium]MBU2595055.1 aldehyde:ferredoxin oxidoreductase [Candidatus Edwardsbacteria bacterium]
MKAAHKVLAVYAFTPSLPQKGYNNRSLHIDLSTLKFTEKKIDEATKRTFTGGRGFGLKYLWDAIKPTTKWNDPENDIIISPGPICGITQYPGAGKSLVVALSPITNIPIDSNVGGYFGPLMKFSGFDALEIQGKAKEDVIIVLDGVKGKITIETAPQESLDSHIAAEQFTHQYATDEADLRNVSVVSAGAAAAHSLIGCLNFSYYDVRRKVTRLKQAGRGGIGTVFRDKKIKALIVHGPQVKGDMNHPADLGRIQRAGVKLHKEMHDFDDKMCTMRKVGTTNIVSVMDAYDLLPVMNFQYGSHPDTKNIDKTMWLKQFTQGIPDGCWYGCSMACAHGVDEFALRTGPYKGHQVIVDGPEYETAAGCGSNCGIFDPLWVIECNFYCDTYGIDTISFGTITGFIMECWQRGILNAERTGGLDMSWGKGESQLELMHQMARGEGFGLIAGQGVQRLKKIFSDKGWGDYAFLNDIGLEGKGLEQSEYMSKESLAQQGGYYLTNKGPQHDEAWVIFMDMVNNQIPTFEDKAEALYYFPMFRTWFGLNGLCKLPWNDIEPGDNRTKNAPMDAAKVPEHVQNYVDLFSGVTGREITKEEIIKMSERVYQFQRVFDLRMGKGTRKYDQPPYRAMGPVTREEYESRQERYDKQLLDWMQIDPVGKSTEEKMALHRKYREDRYQKLVDAVYKRRGWTSNGIPTLETLKRNGIDFPEVVATVLPHLSETEVREVRAAYVTSKKAEPKENQKSKAKDKKPVAKKKAVAKKQKIKTTAKKAAVKKKTTTKNLKPKAKSKKALVKKALMRKKPAKKVIAKKKTAKKVVKKIKPKAKKTVKKATTRKSKKK